MSATSPFPTDVEAERLAALESAAAAGRRRAAAAAAVVATLPPRSDHAWRYTDPRGLLPAQRRLAHGGIRTPVAPAGVTLVPLGPGQSDADGTAPGTVVPAADDPFEALSLALWSAGVLVRVHAEARVEAPITLRHVAPAGGGAAFTRTVIAAAAGSEVSLVEVMDPAAGEDDALVHHVTEIDAGPGSRVVHTVLETRGASARGRTAVRARVGDGASLTTVVVALGGGEVRAEVAATLAGPGARSEVLGAVFGDARRRFDLHVFQDHAAARTFSDLLVRTALRDRARASYTGRLRIAVDAPGCEARQENRNLLLSPDARADSIPELEILTHEVRCAHAAATGPVDPEAIFFLRARGLDLAEAERMLVLGFLEPVLSRVPGEGVADALRAAVARGLGG